ncbi:MAG: zinc ABC transporter substrate-binding protein, partial [Oscillibacter sp.]|nr:zinc ABC transporter substrate-binding protein [Oscillibacter sp.]
FRYLADDYGLDAYAAFQGCSAETEASFETIAFLAAKLDELQLPAVLTTESSDGKIAETIVRTSGRPDTRILSLDSMQSVTATGVAYLSIMESNLDVLRQALGGD